MSTTRAHDAWILKTRLWPAVAVVLAACAGGPPAEHVAPSDGEKSRYSEGERASTEPEVDAGIRADFETAMAYLREGQHEKGTELLTEVARRSPGHTAPYINLAIAYQKMGDLAAAEENVKKALRINPDHPVANTEYGLIYRKTGRFAEARKVYEHILSRYPDFLAARKNLGILCDVYLRDVDCALTHYRLYSAAAPDDKPVRLWIADLEQRFGKKEN